MLRIASLVPSLTETLFDFGLGSRVVARTGFCIHPSPAVKAVPKVGGTKDVNIDKLARLAPTHVLVNVDENRRETVAAIEQHLPSAQILVTHPLTARDNAVLYRQLGQTLACEAAARAAEADLHAALMACQQEHFAPLSALVLVWQDPFFGVARDTYIASMLEQVGISTLPDCLGGPSGAARYPIIDDLPALAQQADLVLLTTEPYAFTIADANAIAQLARRPTLIIDGEMLSWYGSGAPRRLQALRQWRASLILAPSS
jgi:ABC-type Fe3+-hydroxamate transport system substrate-binding protein